MRRDWDLIRALLAAVEALPDSESAVRPEDIEGWDAELISHHIRLLGDAGLLDAKCQGGRRGSCIALGLTWAGHELLDLICVRDVWNRVKKEVRERGLKLTFETVSRLARWVVAEMLP